MSFRDVKDLLAERGILVSPETIRCWTLKFGPAIVQNLRRARPRPTPRWHLDEMAVKIGDVRMYMWRAVDDEGEVLDVFVQKHRNKAAAVKFLGRLLKSAEIHPQAIITDGLYPYRSATRALGCADRHKPGRLRETTGLPILTCRCGGENGRCTSSNPRAPPSAWSPSALPSTISSPFNYTSSPDGHIACLGVRRSIGGTRRQLQPEKASSGAAAACRS